MARTQKPADKPAEKPSTDRPPLVKIGALWLKTSRTGNTFMSGDIVIDGEKIHLMVFKNGYKKESKHPNYVIYESPEHTQDTGGSKITDDDIPF